MDKYVVTIDIAKKLKEVGFPQTTECVYLEWQHKTGPRSQLLRVSTPTKVGQAFAAPIAEEILNLLPNQANVSSFKNMADFWVCKWVSPIHDEKGDTANYCVQYGETLAEAAAKMYIYLKKNNLI